MKIISFVNINTGNQDVLIKTKYGYSMLPKRKTNELQIKKKKSFFFCIFLKQQKRKIYLTKLFPCRNVSPRIYGCNPHYK